MRRVALAGLALFVFSIPTENGVTVAGVGSLSRIVGMLAFGAAAASLFESGRLRMRMPSLFLLVAICFVLWNVATYFWSLAPSASIGEITTYAQLAVVAWLVHELGRTRSDRDLLLQSYVFGCYAMIAVALVSFFGSGDAGFREVGRFNPNAFAIVAALGIPMAWALVLRRGAHLLAPLHLAYPAFAVFAVVLGASRGGLITALVALTVIPLTLGHLGLWKRLALLAALSFGTWGAFAYVPTALPQLQANIERLTATADELERGDLTGRTRIWRAGLDVFATAPVAGVGTGGFRYAVQPILGELRAAHNAFLSVAVGSGLIGLTLYVGLFAIVLATILGTAERRRVHLVLFAALVVAIMPANAEEAKHTWFIMALLAGVRPLVLVSGGAEWERRPVSAATRRTLGDGT